MTPELETLKSKLRATWTAGDFAEIAKAYTKGAAAFVDRLKLQLGMTFLDVACGTGNLALPAARQGAVVSGMDLAPEMIQQARKNAAGEGLTAQFDEGDAEALQYSDNSFDVVATMFGAMFAPRPQLVAAELLRVCKSGGRIAMANWTPSGFVGQMFKATASHVPPPAGMPSPVLWGVEATVRERLASRITNLEMQPRNITFRFPIPPADVVEHFRLYYGPTQKAFGVLEENGRAALRRDLEKLWADNNLATDGCTEVESEYLEVIATKS
ncbi:MAG: SAM-dependent methyltransferase [Blastocatellia bacterium]|nr:MAG: SAM-dependent methyltransferase [Blastocatellia bacterium]